MKKRNIAKMLPTIKEKLSRSVQKSTQLKIDQSDPDLNHLTTADIEVYGSIEIAVEIEASLNDLDIPVADVSHKVQSFFEKRSSDLPARTIDNLTQET